MIPARSGSSSPAGGGRNLFLVRHGETTGGSNLRFLGSTDVPLSREGCNQVRALVPLLAGIDPVALYHSPLARAAQSLDILVEALGWGGGREGLHDLRELDFGACEGLTEAEIRREFPDFHTRWRSGGDYEAFPGGESLAAFSRRVGRATAAVLAAHPRGDLVLVVHKGVLRRILWHLFDRTEPALSRYDPPLASLTQVRETPGLPPTWHGPRLP